MGVRRGGHGRARTPGADGGDATRAEDLRTGRIKTSGFRGLACRMKSPTGRSAAGEPKGRSDFSEISRACRRLPKRHDRCCRHNRHRQPRSPCSTGADLPGAMCRAQPSSRQAVSSGTPEPGGSPGRAAAVRFAAWPALGSAADSVPDHARRPKITEWNRTGGWAGDCPPVRRWEAVFGERRGWRKGLSPCRLRE